MGVEQNLNLEVAEGADYAADGEAHHVVEITFDAFDTDDADPFLDGCGYAGNGRVTGRDIGVTAGFCYRFRDFERSGNLFRQNSF